MARDHKSHRISDLPAWLMVIVLLAMTGCARLPTTAYSIRARAPTRTRSSASIACARRDGGDLNLKTTDTSYSTPYAVTHVRAPSALDIVPEAVENAIADLRLEGLTPAHEVKALLEQFVRGEVTEEQLVAAVLAR